MLFQNNQKSFFSLESSDIEQNDAIFYTSLRSYFSLHLRILYVHIEENKAQTVNPICSI